MLGSNFFEVLVTKENTAPRRNLLLISGTLLTILTIVFSVITGLFILLLLAVLFGFLTWYFVRNQSVEYEYVVAEKSLEITKIIAQSKRKPMIATTLDKITAFGKLSEAPAAANNQTLVIACAAQNDAAYYADFSHETYGSVRLLLTPDERFLDYFSKHLPRNLQFRFTPSEPIDWEK